MRLRDQGFVRAGGSRSAGKAWPQFWCTIMSYSAGVTLLSVCEPRVRAYDEVPRKKMKRKNATWDAQAGFGCERLNVEPVMKKKRRCVARDGVGCLATIPCLLYVRRMLSVLSKTTTTATYIAVESLVSGHVMWQKSACLVCPRTHLERASPAALRPAGEATSCRYEAACFAASIALALLCAESVKSSSTNVFTRFKRIRGQKKCGTRHSLFFSRRRFVSLRPVQL